VLQNRLPGQGALLFKGGNKYPGTGKKPVRSGKDAIFVRFCNAFKNILG